MSPGELSQNTWLAPFGRPSLIEALMLATFTTLGFIILNGWLITCAKLGRELAHGETDENF